MGFCLWLGFLTLLGVANLPQALATAAEPTLQVAHLQAAGLINANTAGLVTVASATQVGAKGTLKFPDLSGRVVDQVGLLSAPARARIEDLLAQHERATTEQVVVVIENSLQGYPIEDYGVALARHWGIGQAKKDNGVILIIAPKEHKARIEVGYGLEGTLTDVLSHEIIQNQIRPAFKKGQYETGVIRGVDAILAVLGGSYQPVETKQERHAESGGGNVLLLLLFIVIIIFSRLFGHGGYWGGGFGGGGFSGGGGGFSGGGGSFGGGGASGDW